MYVDDLTRVHHMHDAACEAVHFTERRKRGARTDAAPPPRLAFGFR
jgi:hypothetical protein